MSEVEKYPDGMRFFNIRSLLGAGVADDDIADIPLLIIRRTAELVQ
jgi:hypothetical protein